jgi:hypothetical protein
MRRPFSEIVRPLALVLALIVVVGWAVLASFYVRGALILDRLPRISADDPKDLGLSIHYEVAGWALIPTAACTLALLAIGVAHLAFSKEPLRWSDELPVLLAGASFAFYWFGPIVGWYLD